MPGRPDRVAIGDPIAFILTDTKLRDRLIEGGLARARDFHPSIIGPAVRAFYDGILS